jgi:hypothetical protein
MYAQQHSTTPTTSGNVRQLPAQEMTMTARRATLQTRPPIQRAIIRSWEYTKPVRVTILAIRLLVALWLVILGAVFVSKGYAWGWALPAAAVGVFAFGVWVFSTAGKGWPAADA